MTRYLALVDELAQAIAGGELPPGAALPSVRSLARDRCLAAGTVARAYAELARAGLIVSSPRRATQVAPDGPKRARGRLRGEPSLALAGSDDPLLDVLVATAPERVERVGARGSAAGLAALWRGGVDAATLHLPDRSGEYNAPFVARVLSGRAPRLVHLWRREQGLVVPPGNLAGLRNAGDLARARARSWAASRPAAGRARSRTAPPPVTALRRAGTGTRALTERLVREAGADPADIRGPEVDSHLDVALAVASGLADAGVCVRSAAVALDLEFVPLVWEPFELALPARVLPRAEALLASLAEPAVARRAEELGGYDLEASGAITSAH